MRTPPLTSVAVALAIAVPLVGAGQAGATVSPSGGAAVPTEGGAHYGETPLVHALASLPRLTAFKLASRTLSTTASYRFAGPHAVRQVRVQVLGATGTDVIKTFSLGSQRPGRLQQVRVPATGLAPGIYLVRIRARGLRTAGVRSIVRVRVPAPKPVPTPTPKPAPATGHVFPVRGAFNFGGADSRFGAKRSGHIHQGQDVAAAEGTPLVAPHAGRVKAARYQARGAGYYVVLSSTGEARDYVFMHLKAGSTLVVEGQLVRAGQQLGQVGATGDAAGPHLHFEIWTGGGWYTGGRPVDPLPYLKAWAGL